MRRKPDYYKVPLRSRESIIDFILGATNQRTYDYHPHPLCFNVKVYRCNLDFDHLLKLWREYNGDQIHTHDADWLKAVKEKHEEIGTNTLYEWGQEDACNQFVDSDAFRMLYDGTEVKVKYSFEGRSGGWLSVNSFEGFDFTDRDTGYEIRQTLTEMDYSTLRKLYQLIVMLKHDVEHPEKEIEHQAAFNFFANGCADIPEPDALQRRFEFAETPA